MKVIIFGNSSASFRPVCLMSNDEAVYEDGSSPLPFVEEPELIGSGSFANVYKVKIAAGHLIMDEATGSAYKVCTLLLTDRYFSDPHHRANTTHKRYS